LTDHNELVTLLHEKDDIIKELSQQIKVQKRQILRLKSVMELNNKKYIALKDMLYDMEYEGNMS